jgi:hypothetical protein
VRRILACGALVMIGGALAVLYEPVALAGLVLQAGGLWYS